MAQLGILFDIDELGGGLYGYSAYKILFDAIDSSELEGCFLSDGDTHARLSGAANHYCIAVESFKAPTLVRVREALAASRAPGLLPPAQRFLEWAEVARELCDAYVRDDKAAIARLEPLATRIGEELNRRGGIGLMRQTWECLGGRRGSRTLDMHWHGIGEWMG